MRLYLIRHAESANNALFSGEDNIQGRTPDPEITETGHRQAELLAQHIATSMSEPVEHPYEKSGSIGFQFDHLYCSLMSRSLLTANYIAQKCDMTLEALPDVYERLGIYEYDAQGNEVSLPGPNRSYFENRFPDVRLPADLGEKGWFNRPVESDAEFIDRVAESIDRVVEKHNNSDHSVGVVVHGDYIDQCVNHLMGLNSGCADEKNTWIPNWVFVNTSISRIDFVGTTKYAVYLNRIDHLPGELSTW